jgi:tetratricopeptide (TPR) repeat protein
VGDFKEAIRACSRAVKLDPLLAAAHYNLSVACYFDKQYNLAMLHLQAALKLGWKADPGFLKGIEQKLTNPKD